MNPEAKISNGAKICCPHCGEKSLQVTTDRDWNAAAVGGGVGTAVGGLGSGMINAASNLRQQTFFVYPKCGNRFKNPRELEADVKLFGRRSKIITVASSIVLALCVFLIVLGVSLGLMFLIVLGLLMSVIIALRMVYAGSRASKPKKELSEIQQEMRRFL